MTETHDLLAIHEQDGVTEFEAPGTDMNDATESDKAMRVEDRLQAEYGTEPACVILPADASPNHPLVEVIDAELETLEVAETLRDRGNEPVEVDR